MLKGLNKVSIIAFREYFAYVKTIGFWLSLLTLPLIVLLSSLVPIFLVRSDPVEQVAVVDITKDAATSDLVPLLKEAVKKEALPENLLRAAKENPILEKAIEQASSGGITITNLEPGGLIPSDTNAKEAIEGAIKNYLLRPETPHTSVLLAYSIEDSVGYTLITKPETRSKVKDRVEAALYERAFHLRASQLGLTKDQADSLNNTPLSFETLRADTVANPKGDEVASSKSGRVDGASVIGALLGYLTWIAVFSSSMLLLTSVIEEKSSRILEVLLASTSADSLLSGKVLGVAMVLGTVVLLWRSVSFMAFRYGVTLLPLEASTSLIKAVTSVMSLQNLVLIIAYLVGGYLMYGMFFAVVGAFCETPKDAQSIIGPTMIFLMIPMLALQSAFVSPDQPFVRYLSYFPLFSPFLMPLRLSHAPLWEVIMTHALIVLVTYLIMQLGRRAFRQGALTSGKVTFKSFFQAMTSRG